MNRITVVDSEGNFAGWFDKDAAKEIADYTTGDPYKYGKILFATRSGKLVVNRWSNTGDDVYSFAHNEAEIVEILTRDSSDWTGEAGLTAILGKYEL